MIIPARNREKNIDYCLRSVLSQTYSNFEVIVIDDGSLDATRKIAEAFADTRVQVISHKKSLGAQAARNTGIKNARGEWIAFQDSDDEWIPEKLEKQVAALTSMNWNDRLVIHTDLYRYYPTTNNKELWTLPSINGKSSYRSLLMSPGPLLQTMLVAKSALFEIGLLDEQVPSYQEWDTAIRLAKICEFFHIREYLAVYWLHEGDTISKNKRLDIDGYRYVIEKHRDEICNVAGKKYWHRHLSRLARNCTKFGFFNDAKTIISLMPLLSHWRWRAVLSFYAANLRRKNND
ncbi:glycosyltransferase family 2 protein [Methylomonas rapida]|uniref:Glycosyltransferase n=1 Tax=Methylomonas rapida TaxID=2963939 RepID=A0ABY7GK67_9GAMM|nr:glycosyltransferase [Methylomonas rapida]WAR44083.1 glycosyltransferase [Methylomonas rapida]